MNRLWLIEDLACNAIDKINADAFQETNKDLLDLAELAQGRSEPVRRTHVTLRSGERL